VEKDALFVAVTRPAMKWGVTMDAIIVGGGLTSIIFIGTGSLMAIFLYPVIHGAMFLLCYKDPRMINLFMLGLQTKGRSLGRRHWGAATASPVINTRPKRRIPQ